MKRVLFILSVLWLAVSVNAQIVFPFGGATTTSYTIADGSYDTTNVSVWNNMAVYSFSIDTSTAIDLSVDSDLRVGADVILKVYSDTTNASTETKTINVIGSDLYATESDTVQQLKTYHYFFRYDGSKLFKVSEGQAD